MDAVSLTIDDIALRLESLATTYVAGLTAGDKRLGNKEITCGNSYSTLWHVPTWADSNTHISAEPGFNCGGLPMTKQSRHCFRDRVGRT
jgi:hypothetical protein